MMLSESKPSGFSPHSSPEGLTDFEESYYFNARWNDADTGRFITEDPVRDGPNWYAYVNNDPVNRVDPLGLSEIYADDIHGAPIVAYVGRDLKAESSITVQRNSDVGFYNDILSVKIRNQTVYQSTVQSEADMPEPDLTTKYDGRTLEAGKYTGILLSNSYSYEKPIQLVDNFLIHPDQYTTTQKITDRINEGKSIGPFSQPFSAGCQISSLNEFNAMTNTLEGLGFEYNGTDQIDVTIKDDLKNK